MDWRPNYFLYVCRILKARIHTIDDMHIDSRKAFYVQVVRVLSYVRSCRVNTSEPDIDFLDASGEPGR